MEVAALLAKLGGVFALAFFSFWAAISMGVALGISPVVVGVIVWISYAAGVLLVVALGEPLRARLMKRFGGKVAASADSPIRRAWDRYGLLGLCLLAPVTTGSQIGTAVALALGAPSRRLLVWMGVGAALWAVALTTVVALGLSAVRAG
ncbi:MAG: small multi-drug export protein [Anaerolineae bacterium]|nr:small multi-drug export protein [Anaerolineae bacterium]